MSLSTTFKVKLPSKRVNLVAFAINSLLSNIYTCTWTMLMFRKLLHIFSGDLRYQFVCKIRL